MWYLISPSYDETEVIILPSLVFFSGLFRKEKETHVLEKRGKEPIKYF